MAHVIGLSFIRDAPWLTYQRVLRIALVFAVISAAALAWNVWDHTRVGLTNISGEQLGVDFINYWSGARLASEGKATTVYNIDAFVRFQRAVTAPHAAFRWYSYPPITMLVTYPLAYLPYVAALACWVLIGISLVALLLSRLVGWKMGLLGAFATPAAFLNIVAGQNGNLTAILMASGVMLLQRYQIAAGILFGLMAYKPHLGVLIPFALAAGGYRKAFIAAALTVIALIAASYVMFGSATWVAFLNNAPLNHLLMEQGIGFWHRMPSAFSVMRLSGFSIEISYATQLVSLVLVVVAVIFIWRGPSVFELKAASLFVGTFLATPYVWDYDLILLVFAVVCLAIEAQRTGFYPWEKATLALVIAMPLLALIIAKSVNVQIGPFVLWGAFYFVLRRTWPSRKGSVPPQLVEMPR